jgi:DNA-binding LytR/AlgR family response regulator
MVRIAICDDDSDSICTLRQQIKGFANKLNIEVIIVDYPSGDNLLFEWSDTKIRPNILYLNIHMPGDSGITVAEKLREGGCNSEIIFYTNSHDEVFEAFDVEAFHYILKKDTSLEKQEAIFRKALAKSNERGESHITFKYGGEHRTIKISKIRYFTIELRVMTVHYEDGKTFDFYSNMEKMNNALMNEGFLRINKTTLINMAYVDSRTNIDVLMKDGTRFYIGKKYQGMAQEEFAIFYKEK